MSLTPPPLPRSNAQPIFRETVEKTEEQPVRQEPQKTQNVQEEQVQLHAVPNNVTQIPQRSSGRRWMLYFGIAMAFAAGFALVLSLGQEEQTQSKNDSWDSWLDKLLEGGDRSQSTDTLDQLFGTRPVDRRPSRRDVLEALMSRRDESKDESKNNQQNNQQSPYMPPITIINPGQNPQVFHAGGNQGGGQQS